MNRDWIGEGLSATSAAGAVLQILAPATCCHGCTYIQLSQCTNCLNSGESVQINSFAKFRDTDGLHTVQVRGTEQGASPTSPRLVTVTFEDKFSKVGHVHGLPGSMWPLR